MSQPVPAIFYDGLTSKPHEALVSVREPNSLEVEVHGERFHWPLEHKGMQWERTGNSLRLAFGDHPRKVVIVRDPLFIKSFALRMQLMGRRGVYDRTLALALKGPILFFAGVLALMVASYIWLLPWAAERMALLLPRTVDRELGEAVFSSMVSSMEEDSARSATLQRFGERLDLSEHYALHYHVVKDEQVNAFALPGGDIVVFTGILDKMHAPEELAGLLAHEATHVEERHSTRMMIRSLSSYLFLSLLLGDVSAVVTVAAEHANDIRNMSYSRDLESNADATGQERMYSSGVDPEGMVHLLELLQEEAVDMPQAMEFLSSHPLTEARIAKAREKASSLGEVSGTDAELQELFDALQQQ